MQVLSDCSLWWMGQLDKNRYISGQHLRHMYCKAAPAAGNGAQKIQHSVCPILDGGCKLLQQELGTFCQDVASILSQGLG